MTLRVGSLVFATDQGIGILAKSFYDAGVVTDVMVVRHGKRPERDDWYPGAKRITCLNDDKQLRKIMDFCQSVDVMLLFETPFVWSLFDWCGFQGKKTALMVMYECMPKVLPSQPDLILCPSLLDLQYYPQGKYLPVPVTQRWYQRDRAEVFVHNAGHGGLKGRNGTRELMEALDYVKSPAKFIIRTQEDFGRHSIVSKSPNVVVYSGTLPYDSLYQEGDVFVFPELFNGLSLPLQEARAAGMLVMSTDRFPMNTWLPREPLIRVSGTCTSNVSPRCNDFEQSIIDPRDIAAKIDDWYGKDISAYSQEGREWAKTMSWEALRPKYVKVLEDLCHG